MRSHFVHLFIRTLQGMPLLVSSNWASWGLGLGVFLLYEIIAIVVRGWPDMVERWKENVAIGLLATAGGYLILFSCSAVITTYDEHHDATGRWQTVVREKNKLKVELTKRDDYIKQLEGRQCPTCPVGAPHKSTPSPVEAKIESASASSRVICTLRDPMKMPTDLLMSFSNVNATYLEGPSGKAYLETSGKLHYQRTEEEGNVAIFQDYSLSSKSDLVGQPVSRMLDYKTLSLQIYGADGDFFSSCKYYEVTFRVNGLDQYRPEDDNGSLPNRLKGNGLEVI